MKFGMYAGNSGNALYCPTGYLELLRLQDRFVYLPEMPYREADLDTSALALARYDARTSGDAPNGQLEVFLDEHFDNARMEHICPNDKKVTKAE